MIGAMRVSAALVSVLACIGPVLAQETRYRDAVFAEVERLDDAVYGWAFNRHSGRTELLLADLYQPRADREARRPVVVVAHGGALRGGDKREPGPARIARDLASRGYVTLSINYRLVPQNHAPDERDVADAAEDLATSVRWLRRNAGLLRIDPTRIATIGNSAGAIMGCEVAYTRPDGGRGGEAELAAVVDLWGFLMDLADLEPHEAPLMIVHGSNDEAVPYLLGLLLYKRALDVGADAVLMPMIGEGHEPWAAYSNDVHEHAVGFLYTRMRLAQLAGLARRHATPPAPPDELTLDTFGMPGDAWVLMAAPARGPGIAFGTLGVFHLDPASFVAAPIGRLRGGTQLSMATISGPLPVELAGSTLHWQALHVAADGSGRLLTNAIATGL
jgi:alpha/beta superfamily hydrolase